MTDTSTETHTDRIADKQERLRQVHKKLLAGEPKQDSDDSRYHSSKNGPTRGPENDAAQRLINGATKAAPLVRDQRPASRMWVVWITLLAYTGCCILLFALTEHWTVLKATYFVVVSVTTVGYGIVTPVHDDTRLLFCFLSFTGLIILGLIGGICWNCISRAAIVRRPRDHGSFRARTLVVIDSYIGYTARNFMLLCLLQLVLFLGGSLFFQSNSGISWTDAMYWTMNTLTTVGHGDVAIKENRGHMWFSIFFVIAGCAITGLCLIHLGVLWVELDDRAEMLEVKKKGITPDMLHAIDSKGRGFVRQHEFLGHMLRELGRVDTATLEVINDMFESSDKKSSNVVRVDDFEP